MKTWVNSNVIKIQGSFINLLCDRFLLQCLYPQIEEEKSDKMTESSALTVQICLCLELGDTEGSHWCESP